MTEYITPCADPANDPNDWFLDKHGRQYDDEPVFTVDEVKSIWDLAYQALDEDPDAPTVDEALDRATAERLRENQVKRRHAKDKCHTECKLRSWCLAQWIDDPAPSPHGIWGGYYPEELRAISRERRRHLRTAVDSRE